MKKHLPEALHNQVHVHSASRAQVPQLIEAFDVLVSFIRPSYSCIAASPTKLAECFAVGIPVICNSGVGDVAEQVRLLGAGVIVDPDSDAELLATAESLDRIVTMGGERLRRAARKIFGLEVAVTRYRDVYFALD
jgi:glycosyltransferase involved in cell wall biosynthesis